MKIKTTDPVARAKQYAQWQQLDAIPAPQRKTLQRITHDALAMALWGTAPASASETTPTPAPTVTDVPTTPPPPAPHVPTSSTQVVEYDSPQAMVKGVAQMTGQGWRVISQSSYTPKKGALRSIAGGLMFANTTPRHTVIYERTA